MLASAGRRMTNSPRIVLLARASVRENDMSNANRKTIKVDLYGKITVGGKERPLYKVIDDLLVFYFENRHKFSGK
jgi:hypothetical protein